MVSKNQRNAQRGYHNQSVRIKKYKGFIGWQFFETLYFFARVNLGWVPQQRLFQKNLGCFVEKKTEIKLLHTQSNRLGEDNDVKVFDCK